MIKEKLQAQMTIVLNKLDEMKTNPSNLTEDGRIIESALPRWNFLLGRLEGLQSALTLIKYYEGNYCRG